MFTVTERYADRPVTFLRVQEAHGWRVKIYSIVYGPRAFDEAVYGEGLGLALAALPQPAQTRERPGVGFAICHQGRGRHYLVLNWWDNENEHFSRVYVRPIEGAAPWREASAGESACVWDLQVIWFERQAYVHTVLARPEAPDPEAYLSRRLTVRPGAGAG